MNVGFTGTRRGMTEQQKGVFLNLISNLKVDEFHHGDCIGADAQADEMVRGHCRIMHIHPPLNLKQRAWCGKHGDVIHPMHEYLVRNAHILDASDLMIATPKEYVNQVRGSGTWSTIRLAKNSKHPLIIIWPDGKISEENRE